MSVFARVLLAVAATAALERAPFPGPPPPRVYVFTAESKTSPPAEDEQERLDSVRDLVEALRHESKIAIAASAAESDVQVEVTGREKRDAGAGGFGGRTVTPLVETMLRIRVTYGARNTEIKGIGQAYWSRAAKDAADRLVRWILRVREKGEILPSRD
jgi:hypothetical protein